MKRTSQWVAAWVALGALIGLTGCEAVADLFSDREVETSEPDTQELPAACGSSEGCPSECYRPYLCATECGEPTINCGCCGCPEGLVDVIADCPQTAAPTPASPESPEGQELPPSAN